ncbi:MAG: hypothetical protein IPH53_04815 [Flavobacteriales bacterium]|nr:hypothetical protein [Flavobacteriales bacterium]
MDLCAAPGGKSGHLRNLLHSSSLLISNEVIPARAAVLAQNLWKQGAENTPYHTAASHVLRPLAGTFRSGAAGCALFR